MSIGRLTVFLTAVVLMVVAIIAVIFSFHNKHTPIPKTSLSSNGSAILFVGEGCPHCAKVEQYLTSHPEVNQKLVIEQKEVWSNEDNAKLMDERADTCQPALDSPGVPFLWNNGKCVVGDTPIIDYFSSL